jgi:DNA-binding protein HU-beta
MNTGQLVETIAKKNNMTKAQAQRVFSSVVDTIKGEVKKGRAVRIVGFGTFERGKRKARKGRNPQTGEAIKIKATKYPKFRPGQDFKTIVK